MSSPVRPLGSVAPASTSVGWPVRVESLVAQPGTAALLTYLQSDQAGLVPSTDTAAGARSAHQAEAGLQRLAEFAWITRERLAALESAHGRFLASQRAHLAACVLHRHISTAVGQLAAEATEGDADAEVVRDLDLYWQMAQAEGYLQTDGTGRSGEDASTSSDKPFGRWEEEPTTSPSAAAAATAAGTPASMFGLSWQTMSGAFRPRSSGIPMASAIHISSSRPMQSAPPSFTSPSSSGFLSSLQSTLLPAVSGGILDQHESLMEAFDADGEERRAEEELAGTRDGRVAGLPPVDTRSLPSLLSYRLARTHAARRRRREEQRLAGETRAAHDRAIVNNLRLTSTLLRGHLESELATTTSTAWLAAKAAVIAGKAAKLEAELMRDTYLGVPSASASVGRGSTNAAGGPPQDPRQIIPSLQVIRSSLEGLHSASAHELKEKLRQVTEYRSMGAGFDALATEYAAVRRQIENKRWTLKELHSHAGVTDHPSSRGRARQGAGGFAAQ